MRNPSFHIVLLLLLLCLPACAFLAAAPTADDLYVLKAQTPAPPPTSGSRTLSIMVALPDAAPGLNTERMAIEGSPNLLRYYTGASWARPLPDMVQVFLADTLQRSQRFASVNTDREGVLADVVLLTDLPAFAVETTANATNVHIRLVFKLADANSHKVMAVFPVEKTVPAKANKMPAIVAAFNDALNQAAGDLLSDLFSMNGTAAFPAPAP